MAASLMRRFWEVASRAAAVNSTVLITGESGVGKERVARWLHEVSPRAAGPFVPVNCSAFTETLLEGELFGHAKGAFTGAHRDRVGVFEAAHTGTLFLDEVGEVSPAMQARLLRVVQEREIRRLGEATPRHIDIRLIAATNRDLQHEVECGRFRQDLYFRLQVIELRVPPLRERAEEISRLAGELLERIAGELGRPAPRLTARALERLERHRWPGNVRELEHALEWASAMTTGAEIDVEDLPPAVRYAATTSEGPARTRRPLDAVQREYVLSALARHHGNRRRTAEELQISLATLKRKLRPLD
jgi:DNA-binding NtrC family response regulator